MDSFSHLTIGVTLAGLLYNIPFISEHPEYAVPVTAACIAGSLAPDLDAVTRIKPELYLKFHRGISHSFILSPVWILLLAAALGWLMNDVPFAYLLVSAGAGYLVHIGLDALNSYGTMIAFPYRNTRVGLHVLPLYDPVLGASHLLFALIWCFQGAKAAPLFVWLYAGTGCYIWMRFAVRRKMERSIKRELPSGRLLLLPTPSCTAWKAVEWGEEYVRSGIANRDKVLWFEPVALKKPNDPYICCSEGTKEVQALRQFSPFLCVRKDTDAEGVVIRWFDLRYMGSRKYQLMAWVTMDRDYRIRLSRVGWFKPDIEPETGER